jgi:MFS family permease
VSQTSGQAPSASTHTGPSGHTDHHRRSRRSSLWLRHRRHLRRTDSIKLNFVAPLGLAESARISLEGWTISAALAGCIIGGALGGVVAHWLGRRGGLIVAGTLFFISSLGSAWPESFIGVLGSLLTRSSMLIALS